MFQFGQPRPGGFREVGKGAPPIASTDKGLCQPTPLDTGIRLPPRAIVRHEALPSSMKRALKRTSSRDRRAQRRVCG